LRDDDAQIHEGHKPRAPDRRRAGLRSERYANGYQHTALTQPRTNTKEEAMTRKLTTFLAAAAILGGVATATTVFAEESRPSPQPPGTQGMMGDHGGMMNMMGQMTPDQMRQMTRMVDNCNRMMESMSNAPSGPDHRTVPDTHE
jgi:hypothetical protein